MNFLRVMWLCALLEFANFFAGKIHSQCFWLINLGLKHKKFFFICDFSPLVGSWNSRIFLDPELTMTATIHSSKSLKKSFEVSIASSFMHSLSKALFAPFKSNSDTLNYFEESFEFSSKELSKFLRSSTAHDDIPQNFSEILHRNLFHFHRGIA